MTLRWGIVTTGRHAEHKIAPAIAATPSAELVAVYSRDQGRADAFAERHGAQAAYSSLDTLLQDTRVDAVFVTSPNALHARQTVQAAQAGKHVLVEKPMATTIDDAVAMIRACREHGVRLGVGFHLRCHPAHQEARRVVEAGTLGPIALAQGQWGFGVRGQATVPPRPPLQQWWDDPAMIGGASTLMGTGVHVLDLLRFVLNQDITEVTACADGQTPEQPLEQLLTMTLRFADGTLATATCGRRLPDSENDLALYGSLGRLVGRDTLRESRQGALDIVSETVNTATTFDLDPIANYIDELEDFDAAVATGREPMATGVDGLRVVEATLAVITAAREGRTVHLEPRTP